MKNKQWIYTLSLAVLATSCGQPRQREDIVAQQFVHSYGVEVPMNDWSSRGKNGQVITILDTGEKVTNTYFNGVLHGDTTTSFPHQETIQHVQKYEQGNLVEETINDPRGVPMRRMRYLGANHQKITLWFENGSPQSVEEWTNNKLMSGEYYSRDNQVESRIVDGNGTRTNRDHYGLHISTEEVNNGAVIERTLFYPNGVPKEILPIQADVPHGIKKTFLPSGEPQTVEEWYNGQQQGITMLYRNGEKIAEVPYAQGKKNGVERRYSDGVKVVEEIGWKDDQRHGLSRVYVASTIKDQWYYRGQMVSQSAYDRMNRPEIR